MDYPHYFKPDFGFFHSKMGFYEVDTPPSQLDGGVGNSFVQDVGIGRSIVQDVGVEREQKEGTVIADSIWGRKVVEVYNTKGDCEFQ